MSLLTVDSLKVMLASNDLYPQWFRVQRQNALDESRAR